MKKAFTLMEVTLAISVMAVGVLALASLYSFGFRENRQSAEDVAGVAFAQAVIARLTTALSATNLTWESFNSLEKHPSEHGWADYFNINTGIVESDPTPTARVAFSDVMNKLSFEGGDRPDTSWPSAAESGLRGALLVYHEKDSAIARIAFRSSQLATTLLATPLYYTVVRFQGVDDRSNSAAQYNGVP